MADDLWWRDADAEYIRSRSDRYPGATNLEPEWTLEAAADPQRILRDPDPKSRIGAIRIIGYSPQRRVRDHSDSQRWGACRRDGWKSSGADLRDYEGQGRQ